MDNIRFDIVEHATGSDLDEIVHLIRKYQDDFVPPLHKRGEDGLNVLVDNGFTGDSFYAYVSHYHEFGFVRAFDNDKLVGVMVYKYKEQCQQDDDDLNNYPQHYVSCIVIDKPYRNLGLTTKLYDVLMKNIPSGECVATRTWRSEKTEYSNGAHLHILDKLGFEINKVIKDDRGKGIDTVHAVKRID